MLLDEEEIHHPIGQEDIHIVPVISGAGRGTGRILLGAALIGASFLFPGAGMFGTVSASGQYCSWNNYGRFYCWKCIYDSLEL